ncbi:uncharacterized protein LOC144118402 [Amblyomma americanum]
MSAKLTLSHPFPWVTRRLAGASCGRRLRTCSTPWAPLSKVCPSGATRGRCGAPGAIGRRHSFWQREGALEAAGGRGCQAVCASCGRQTSCKASQIPCFLPPARHVNQPRVSVGEVPGTSGLQQAEARSPSDTQEQPAVVPGRPRQQQRSSRVEEVCQLLAETRCTNDLFVARNVEDVAFHAHLLEMKRTGRKWKTLCILKQQATVQTGGYAVKTCLTGLMR